MSSWDATKYKTTNWLAYNEALRQRGSLTIWFDPDMEWIPPPTGRRRRQRELALQEPGLGQAGPRWPVAATLHEEYAATGQISTTGSILDADPRSVLQSD